MVEAACNSPTPYDGHQEQDEEHELLVPLRDADDVRRMLVRRILAERRADLRRPAHVGSLVFRVLGPISPIPRWLDFHVQRAELDHRKAVRAANRMPWSAEHVGLEKAARRRLQRARDELRAHLEKKVLRQSGTT